MEGPLLMVGEELEEHEQEDKFGKEVVVGGEAVAREARGEEEDVGGCCDGAKEDLGRLVLDNRKCEVRGVLTLCASEMKTMLKMNIQNGPT